MIKHISTQIVKLFDLAYSFRFIVKLIVLFFFFNFCHYCFIGITVPGGGLYSSFLDHYLNYVDFIKTTVLHTASFFANLFGVGSFIDSPNTARVAGGGRLFMARPCYGLEIMSFWMAFMIADSTRLKRKILWGIGGLLAIWTINCIRIGLLLGAIKYRWPVLHMDHHQMFTICAYGLLFILLFFYYKGNKKQLGN